MLVGQFLSFGIGGADKASYGLTKGLKELGVDVMIFYNRQSFPNPGYLSRFEQVQELGLPMCEIDKISDLNKYGLSVLNTHRSGDDSWFVPGFEQTDFNFKVVETNINGYLYTKSDIRVFPSNEMLKGKRLDTPYVVIYNAIIDQLNNDDLRETLNLGNKFVFGRLTRPELFSKTALEAFKIIENDDIHFLYVAPDDIARTFAKRLNIKNITFVNQTVDEILINKLYNTFDVFCHCNPIGETFGNTVAEAMMHGKPVVSHLGSAGWPQAQKEVLGDYSHYVCNDHVRTYRDLMTTLMTNKKEYDDYSSYVKNRATSLFDYRVVAKKYLEVYEGLVS